MNAATLPGWSMCIEGKQDLRVADGMIVGCTRLVITNRETGERWVAERELEFASVLWDEARRRDDVGLLRRQLDYRPFVYYGPNATIPELPDPTEPVRLAHVPTITERAWRALRRFTKGTR